MKKYTFFIKIFILSHYINPSSSMESNIDSTDIQSMLEKSKILYEQPFFMENMEITGGRSAKIIQTGTSWECHFIRLDQETSFLVFKKEHSENSRKRKIDKNANIYDKMYQNILGNTYAKSKCFMILTKKKPEDFIRQLFSDAQNQYLKEFLQQRPQKKNQRNRTNF